MENSVQPACRSGRQLHRWLLILPFIWQAVLAPWVNDVAYRPLGLPFPMAWQMAGIVLASIVIGAVFRLDRLAGVEDEEAAFLAATPAHNGSHP
ncbi:MULTISPECIES: DUF3311 domain-containing protein [Achromobacter]|uniref:DUF3311 domain-containing protein n=1 Tax=Achromobacter sp. TaxID=134375 RepID=UPI002F94413E